MVISRAIYDALNQPVCIASVCYCFDFVAEENRSKIKKI